jgi:hypothetical protein
VVRAGAVTVLYGSPEGLTGSGTRQGPDNRGPDAALAARDDPLTILDVCRSGPGLAAMRRTGR